MHANNDFQFYMYDIRCTLQVSELCKINLENSSFQSNFFDQTQGRPSNLFLTENTKHHVIKITIVVRLQMS